MYSAEQNIQVRHAAAVASELLDNDEDGKVDDPNIEFALREDLAKNITLITKVSSAYLESGRNLTKI